MVRKFLFPVALFATLVIAFIFFQMRTRNQIRDFASIDRMVLYSIDGRGTKQLEQMKFDEYFHKIPVLGKTEITSANERAKILNALNSGIAQGDRQAACFWPRHGLRIERDGQTTDYVICFYCYFMKVFTEESETTVMTSRAPKVMFNEYLTAAEIPLAPE